MKLNRGTGNEKVWIAIFTEKLRPMKRQTVSVNGNGSGATADFFYNKEPKECRDNEIKEEAYDMCQLSKMKLRH